MPATSRRLSLGRWAGSPGLNPVLVRELRGRFRRPRAFALVGAFITFWAVAAWMMEAFESSSGPMGLGVNRGGDDLLQVLTALEATAILLIAPGMTAGALSGEFERRTLDLLLATPLGARRIVVGKFLAAIAFIVLVISTALPGLSLAFILGGVSPAEVVIHQLAILIAGTYLAALGLAASSLSTSTARATVMAYLGAALLCLMPWLISAFLDRHSLAHCWGPSCGSVVLAVSPLSLLAMAFDGSYRPWQGVGQLVTLHGLAIVVLVGGAAARIESGRNPLALGRRGWRLALALLLWLVWIIGWPRGIFE